VNCSSDIDECATGAAGCDADATCTIVPGSFSCSCNSGYDGDGQTCTGIPLYSLYINFIGVNC